MRLRAAVLMIAIAAVFAVMAAGAFAGEYYVDGANGTDDDSHGGSPGKGAWKTVAYALRWIETNDPGSAADPHTINIAAGTYDSSIGERYPLNMQDYVSLSGEDEATTVLDAENAAYHIIYCDNVNDFTIENLTITGGNANGSNEDGNGAGVYCDDSSPTLTNCTITGNTATHDGAGIYCQNYSYPTLTDCTISGNTAKEGGGICCYYSAPTLTNCTITDNTTQYDHGGGICCHYSSPGLINCTISGNTAKDGGAIFCDDSYPWLINCTISGNTAYRNGGAIYCRYSSSLKLTNCTLSGNAANHGGGISCYESSPTLTDCTLSGNTANYWGGGICCVHNASPTLTNWTITDNTALWRGGIYCLDSSPTLTDCTVSGNETNEDGGGIYCERSSPTINNCVITSNDAVNGGGICFGSGSSAAVVNNVIAGNAAQEGGGGVYCCDSSDVIFAICTISQNTADYGGGICCRKQSYPKVINSILWDNSPREIYVGGLSFIEIIYSCVQGGWSGHGNIDEDPLFVPLSDAPYYLAHDGPQAANSPCIDAGAGRLDEYADFGVTSAHTTCTDGREDGDDDGDGGTGPIDMGYHYLEGYDGNGDTSINLTSFEARPDGSAILVTWETGAEIDNAGFALFREIAGTQDYMLISDLIPGQGAPASGASYSFTDTDVEPGITYNYWLVDVETSGEWTAHGPASARLSMGLELIEHQSAFANLSAKAGDGGSYGGQATNTR